MTDSLGDILSKRGHNEPPEIKIIKDFVHAEVGIIPQIKITKTTIVVALPSAAAAGTLRFRIFQLQRQLGHDRKILIRII